MPGAILIIGGGVSGMLTALLLRQRNPGYPIIILEQSAQPGGIYRSVNYGLGGDFDYGMHILYDCGIPELDDLIHDVLPENQWHVLEGNRKDIAGIYWNGKLQQHSPYLDLRSLPVEELQRCIEEVKAAALHQEPTCSDVQGYFEGHFGKTVANYYSRVIEKLYETSAQQVSRLAANQPAMNRVLLFDKEHMQEVLHSEALRARIGYPDQLTLPLLRSSSQCGWYPRRFGMSHFIDRLYARLAERGVEFLLNASVQHMDCKGNRVQSLDVETPQGSRTFGDIAGCYWTAGIMALAKFTGAPSPALESPVMKAAHVHLRLEEMPDMGELYHFYCYEKGYRTFRVTNYASYCPGARNVLGYPVCVELWPQAGDAQEKYVELALAELRSLRVIGENIRPNFSAVLRAPNYHRMFSLQTIKAIDHARNHIREQNLTNLFNIGILAESGELLLYEILRDAHAKVERFPSNL